MFKKTTMFLLVALAMLSALAGSHVAVASTGPDDEFMADRVSGDNRPVAAWCGKLGSYTAIFWNGWEPKPTLFVWKNGKGKPNPYNLTVKYNGKVVPNSDDGVKTSSGPQQDLGNGWVGYHIAKRFYIPTGMQWDDDWRWEVYGCLP